MNTIVKRSLQDILNEKKAAAKRRIEEENYNLPIPATAAVESFQPILSTVSNLETAIAAIGQQEPPEKHESFALSISLFSSTCRNFSKHRASSPSYKSVVKI